MERVCVWDTLGNFLLDYVWFGTGLSGQVSLGLTPSADGLVKAYMELPSGNYLAIM